MKINIVGTSGSGKSTLARRMAAELALPYIEMDTLYWLPDWQGTPDHLLFARLETVLNASPGWVLDGNYNRTRPVKWRNVDLVVWLCPYSAPGGDAGGKTRLDPAGAVARHRQPGKFSALLFQPRVDPAVDDENLAQQSRTL